ncbi:ribosomal RNA small subunit methyltransferase A [Amycolatopsis nigrescens]|uniref:ribosomal RNA small subunit methyltransferase A n=1 Tax=Amycolatopsis nigrescens TaxID=381445 RepID=UPI00039B8394|nr:rRNA adenine dimethyltransferase family protein [Amycolatopsis nigrescens]
MPASGPSRRDPRTPKNPKPNSSGAHFLAAPRIIEDLIRHCAIDEQDLVLDLGAGFGAITAPLARTGAKVLAVERDPEFARRLRRRLDDRPNVRVVTADLRTVSLPRNDFLVVSSIPYAVSSALLRRLLSPRSTPLRRAELVVEWGFAKRLTTAVPRSPELAWWAARFQLSLRKRVPAACFSPPPKVDSAHLAVRRNTGLSGRAEHALWFLLDAAYRARTAPVRTAVATALAGRNPRRALAGAGIDPAAEAGAVRPAQWAALAGRLAEDPALHWPRLPPELSGHGVTMRR